MRIMASNRGRFDTATGETFQLNGFYMIDEEKFGQIVDENLPELFHGGALGLVYLHLASLDNMQKLPDRVSVRSAEQKQTVPAANCSYIKHMRGYFV